MSAEMTISDEDIALVTIHADRDDFVLSGLEANGIEANELTRPERRFGVSLIFRYQEKLRLLADAAFKGTEGGLAG